MAGNHFLLHVEGYLGPATGESDGRMTGVREDTGQRVTIRYLPTDNKRRVALSTMGDSSSRYHVPPGGSVLINGATPVPDTPGEMAAKWATAITKKSDEVAIVAPFRIQNTAVALNGGREIVNCYVLGPKAQVVKSADHLRSLALGTMRSHPQKDLKGARIGMYVRVYSPTSGRGFLREFVGNRDATPEAVWDYYADGKNMKYIRSLLEKEGQQGVVEVGPLVSIALKTFNNPTKVQSAIKERAFVAPALDSSDKPRWGYQLCAVGVSSDINPSTNERYFAEVARWRLFEPASEASPVALVGPLARQLGGPQGEQPTPPKPPEPSNPRPAEPEPAPSSAPTDLRNGRTDPRLSDPELSKTLGELTQELRTELRERVEADATRPTAASSGMSR